MAQPSPADPMRLDDLILRAHGIPSPELSEPADWTGALAVLALEAQSGKLELALRRRHRRQVKVRRPAA